MPGIEVPATSRLLLESLAPNPFNPTTTVTFTTLAPGPVTLDVHDMAGRLVASRALGELPTGQHRASWDGRDAAGRNVASGLYILRLRDALGAAATARALLVR